MKKLFISQPMRGKSDEQIKAEREKAIADAQSMCGEQLEPIDSFFTDHNPSNPLFSLGRSILKMGEADIVYFAPGWSAMRGCQCEHYIAMKYGLEYIDGELAVD